MNVDIYHAELCGSYHALRRNIDLALRETGIPADVAWHTITYDDAVRLGIPGSPSIWINGADAFSAPGDPSLL